MKVAAIIAVGFAVLAGAYWHFLERQYWLEFNPRAAPGLPSHGLLKQVDHSLEITSDWIPAITAEAVYHTYSSSWNPINALDFRISYVGGEEDLAGFRVIELVATGKRSGALRFRRVRDGKQVEHFARSTTEAVCESWAPEMNVLNDGHAQVQRSVIRDSAIRELPRESFDAVVRYQFRGKTYESHFTFAYRTELRNRYAIH